MLLFFAVFAWPTWPINRKSVNHGERPLRLSCCGQWLNNEANTVVIGLRLINFSESRTALNQMTQIWAQSVNVSGFSQSQPNTQATHVFITNGSPVCNLWTHRHAYVLPAQHPWYPPSSFLTAVTALSALNVSCMACTHVTNAWIVE